MNPTAWGIVIAAGASEQITEGVEVAFLNVGIKPVVAYSMMAFEHCPEIEKVIIIARKERQDTIRALAQRFGCTKLSVVMAGGITREAILQSVPEVLGEDVNTVVLHEASRPLITSEFLSKLVGIARRYGVGTAATRIPETVQLTTGQSLASHPLAEGIPWITHTPCAMQRDIFEKGLAAEKKRKARMTDETELARLVKAEVRLVEMAPPSLKIRNASDLAIAAALLR